MGAVGRSPRMAAASLLYTSLAGPLGHPIIPGVVPPLAVEPPVAPPSPPGAEDGRAAAGVALAAGDPLGLYVHIPFCAQKCPYCDFNTYADLDDLFDAYVAAVCREIDAWGPRLAGRTIGTVFVGGGTPTVLGLDQLARILGAARRSFTIAADAEITSEANPGTVDRDRFRGLRDLGVNRLSMGVQSFQPDELRFLGRIHDVADVHRAYDAARAAGFANINLDFMFGLPGQSPPAWSATLHAALDLAPEHLSLYSLIVEPNTPLHQWVQTGRVAAPDDDAAATLYEQALAILGAAGYRHYEVSNWAREGRAPAADGGARAAEVPTATAATVGGMPAFACRHNLVYWRNQAYLGVGPGAHSHLRLAGPAGPTDRRWGNLRPVPGYIRRVASGAPLEAFGEDIDAATAMGETMMLGLRLVEEGVAFDRFAALHGADLGTVFAEPLGDLEAWGLIDRDARRVRLTARGLMVGNQVFERFMP